MSRAKPASGSLTPTSPVSTSDAPRADDFLDGSHDAALLAEVEEYRRRFEDLLMERAVEMREAAARVRRESDDRRRAEADARASEQLFRILVERSSDLIMVVDAEARVTYCSPSTERLTGYRQDEITGMVADDLIHHEDLARVVALRARHGAETDPEPVSGTLRLRTKDGSLRWFEWSASNHLDDEAVRGIVVSARDVTDRRLAQDAIVENERRYRSLFEDSPAAMWEEDHSATKAYLEELVTSGVGDIESYLREHPAEYLHCLTLARTLDVNNAAVALCEASSREELIERQDELCPSASAGGLAVFWAAMLAGRHSASYEDTNVTLAGRTIHVMETCTVAPGHEDTFDRVYITDVDVSERRRSEELLRRYRLLFAEARDIMLFVRAEDGRILEANAAAETAYGYSREELTQLAVEALRRAGDRATVGGQLSAAAAGGILFETVHQRKDGSTFPVEVSSRGIITLGGETLLLSVIRDVTTRKDTESELAQTTEQLEHTLQAAVAALGAVAELRDPYTAGHQRRVADLACAIAIELGWGAERIATLRTAALLHDLGKIVVPAEILSKPGKLTDTEFLLIRQHAGAGAEILADIDFQVDIAAMVRQHHERLDGSGYPDGLKDADILPEARVLAVADVVEAMVSHRPYRPALPLDTALAEIERGSGRRYDAGVCAACSRLIREERFAF
jgi:PAS domain S-box-containing protein/putative nucleotidyltransferase with HDIG domain